jgi:hypothetical protein
MPSRLPGIHLPTSCFTCIPHIPDDRPILLFTSEELCSSSVEPTAREGSSTEPSLGHLRCPCLLASHSFLFLVPTMRPVSSASSTSPLPRHVTSRLVFASEPSFTSPGERRVHFADHPLSPHLEQRCSAPIEPELARDPVPKPRSRRCFVCGTTGMHPLDFRVCPRTAVLLR